MRVLHVVDRWTDRGGAYQHLRSVIERQRGKHTVLVAAGADDGRAPVPLEVMPPLAARSRVPVELRPLRSHVRPDVVHVHNVMNPDVLESVGSWTGVGRVLTVQDHRVFCPGQGKWTESGERCTETMSKDLCAQCFSDDAYFEAVFDLTEVRRAALSRYEVVVLSDYMKRELAISAHVVPPFVDGLDGSGPTAGAPCVLFVGRLVRAKGVRDAVDAWRRSGVSLPLVFAGSGPLREELAAHEGVEVTGWLSRAELSTQYRRARALLMPSRWQEPFGIAGLEALGDGGARRGLGERRRGGVAPGTPRPLG